MRRRLQSQTWTIYIVIFFGVGLCYYLLSANLSRTTSSQLNFKESASKSKQEVAVGQISQQQLQIVAASSGRNWRTIHQQLDSLTVPSGTDFSRATASWQLSWQSCMHGWRHRLWTEADNNGLVQTSAPWFRPTYKQMTDRRERLMALRYLYLYVFGGVYADLDSRCLRSFEHLLSDCGVAFSAAHNGKNSLATSMMFSKPGHQLWLRVLKLMHDIVWRRRSLPPGVSSVADPQLLAWTVERNLHSFKDGGRNRRVCVMPAAYFAPSVGYELDGSSAAAGASSTGIASSCRPWWQMTDRDLTRCESANIRSYVLHLPAAIGE